MYCMYSPTEYWSKLGTQKWAYGIDGHRPTQDHDEMQSGTVTSTTYVATSELENMSLTLPPVTLRNAAPLYPQINRKARYTAVERRHGGYHTGRTEGCSSWGQDRTQQK